MTQNNEREAFELLISIEYEHPTDLTRDGDGYSDGYVDNAWWGWCKALHYSKSPISQNEQQEAVVPFAYVTEALVEYWKTDPMVLGCEGKFQAYLFNRPYKTAIIPLYTSPPKQAIPDGWKLVRIEPTDEMCIKAREVTGISSNAARHVFISMINAAPTNTEVGE